MPKERFCQRYSPCKCFALIYNIHGLGFLCTYHHRPVSKKCLSLGEFVELPEKSDYSRTSFYLRSALPIDENYSTFVWLLLFYRTRNLLDSSRAAVFESPRFRIVSNIRYCSAMVCLRAHCRVSVTSAPRFIQCNARIWLLNRVFSIPLTGGLFRRRLQHSKEDTFRVVFRESIKRLSLLGIFGTLGESVLFICSLLLHYNSYIIANICMTGDTMRPINRDFSIKLTSCEARSGAHRKFNWRTAANVRIRLRHLEFKGFV